MAKPNIVIYKDKKHTQAIIKDYKPGQVNIYINILIRNSRAEVSVYTTLSKATLLKTVASSN